MARGKRIKETVNISGTPPAPDRRGGARAARRVDQDARVPNPFPLIRVKDIPEGPTPCNVPLDGPECIMGDNGLCIVCGAGDFSGIDMATTQMHDIVEMQDLTEVKLKKLAVDAGLTTKTKKRKPRPGKR